jgi:hypothetical protein
MQSSFFSHRCTTTLSLLRSHVASAGVAISNYRYHLLLVIGFLVGFRAVLSYAGFVILPSEMLNAAINLAETRTLGNPYSGGDTGPTAHVPPVYASVLALLWHINPGGGLFTLSLIAITALAFAVQICLLPAVSESLTGRRAPGYWAAALLLILPLYQMMPQWDTQFLIACSIAAVLLADSAIVSGSRVRVAASGFAAGIVFLINPAAIPILAPLFLLLILRRSSPLIRNALLISGGVLLAITPWTVRNYRTFGSFFLIRNNFGLELQVSNNDCSDVTLVSDLLNGCHARYHPNVSSAEAARIRAVGEVTYNAEKLKEGRLWIAENPDRFARLTLARVREFWFPSPEHMPHIAYANWTISILLGLSIVFCWRTNRLFIAFATATLLAFSATYYLIHLDFRHRAPSLWISALLGGLLAEYIAEYLNRKEESVTFTKRMNETYAAPVVHF